MRYPLSGYACRIRLLCDKRVKETVVAKSATGLPRLVSWYHYVYESRGHVPLRSLRLCYGFVREYHTSKYTHDLWELEGSSSI